MTCVDIIFFYIIMLQIIIHFQFLILSAATASSSSNKYLHIVDSNGRDYGTSSTAIKPLPEEAFHTQTHRKILRFQGTSCSARDLSISQSKGSTSGVPQYIVQIVNTCVSSSAAAAGGGGGGSCAPSDIHLHCGWFASARIVNPRFFKRLSYDDCLVNGGQALTTGQIISFSYSNSFMYPLSLKHATFC